MNQIMTIQQALDHFPAFTPTQKTQFEALESLYQEWNAKINVVSRKDMENLVERHILESLAFVKWLQIHEDKQFTTIVDVGTGGGFPAVMLAIAFPEVEVLALDSVGKKLTVIEEIAHSLQILNLMTFHGRAESHTGTFDLITGRGVTAIPAFIQQTKHLLNNTTGLGILYVKGTDALEDQKAYPNMHLTPIKDYFPEAPLLSERYILFQPTP